MIKAAIFILTQNNTERKVYLKTTLYFLWKNVPTYKISKQTHTLTKSVPTDKHSLENNLIYLMESHIFKSVG